MTTNPIMNVEPIFRTLTFPSISSNDTSNWEHPILEIFRPPAVEVIAQKAKLFLLPSTFGEDYDPNFAPQPTSASDLPELHSWTLKFVVSVLEIWAAKRQPAQLSRWCHHNIYNELIHNVGSQKEVGRIRHLHQSEPLDGICESTITVRYGDRLRSIAVRFEGIDKRWLCTALALI